MASINSDEFQEHLTENSDSEQSNYEDEDELTRIIPPESNSITYISLKGLILKTASFQSRIPGNV